MKQLFKIKDGQFGHDLNRAAIMFSLGILFFLVLILIQNFIDKSIFPIPDGKIILFICCWFSLPAILFLITLTIRLARNICHLIWPKKDNFGSFKITSHDDFTWLSIVVMFYINLTLFVINVGGKEFILIPSVLWFTFLLIAKEGQPNPHPQS